MLSCVIIGYLVDEFSVWLQRTNRVRKTNRNKDLIPLIRRNFRRNPFAKSWRPAPYVDRYIKNAAANNSNELILRKRRALIMQTPKGSGSLGERLIVLNKVEVNSGLRKRLLIVSFREKSS